MPPAPDHSTFESAYAAVQAPWDIGKPSRFLVDVADQITGTVLDAGCVTSPDWNATLRASTSSKKQSAGAGGRRPNEVCGRPSSSKTP